MARSTVQLEETHAQWLAHVFEQIKSFDQGAAETLRLNIEAEKVSLLYEIATQLALMNSRRTV
jgi:hypothetical protein